MKCQCKLCGRFFTTFDPLNIRFPYCGHCR